MLAAVLAAGAATASAPPEIQVEYEVGVVSDYRFRGLSLSNHNPALQLGATATLASGAYAGIWGSTIDEYASEGDPHGAQVEIDVSAGRAFSAVGWDWDLGVAAYTYPRAQDLAYLEVPVSASHGFGRATVTLGGAYAPSQTALGHRDNRYAYAGASWPAGLFQLNVQAGYEHGAFAPDGKWDWTAAISRRIGPVRAELSYIDSNRRSGSAGLVGGMKVEF